MTYQEREIPHASLERHLDVLDSDEGIRVESAGELVFINRTSKRYCLGISKDGKDEFFYIAKAHEVLKFLSGRLEAGSKIFAY